MLKEKKETLKPWCVAIIDDSPDDRAEIRRMLLNGSERRLRFIEAGTAEAGIQAVLGATHPPDCIVLDYNLPEMEAPEMLAALTGPDGMPVCPVIVVTGGDSREEGRRVLRAGACCVPARKTILAKTGLPPRRWCARWKTPVKAGPWRANSASARMPCGW